jgi:protein-S-isoprenylcysteine O-methyltransferase Ste14
MEKIIIFMIISAGITRFSWPYLRSPRLHGFYRFFAFESLLALGLINVNFWIRSPFSIPQILSWILLAASAFLAIHGFTLLRIVGKPQGSFENTSQLVIVGAYRFIRHPLYASLLFLGWGAFLKQFSWLGLALVAAITLLLILTARVEEAENVIHFGESYSRYMKRTKMFIPYVF